MRSVEITIGGGYVISKDPYFTEYPINVMVVGDFRYIGLTKSRRQSPLRPLGYPAVYPDIGPSHQPLDAMCPRLRFGMARKGKVLRIGLLRIFGDAPRGYRAKRTAI